MLRTILLFSLLLPHCFLFAQPDYSWWIQKHNWNGVTRFKDYLIISPGYFGPNALPVPELQDGQIDTTYTFELGLEGHLSDGDDTGNLFARLFFPLFSRRVGLNLQIVPFEVYRMDTLIRDERRSADFDGRGHAIGDLYIGTFIQLLEENEKRPGLLFNINLRTAMGTNSIAARFTDKPGYFFDLSTGKTFARKSRRLAAIRPYATVGFYVFQANGWEQPQRQNDCFLFGGGVDLRFRHILLRNQVTGYIGYLNNRDRPIVYRLRLQSQFKGPVNLQLAFQTGLHEWMYTSFRLSGLLRIDRKGLP